MNPQTLLFLTSLIGVVPAFIILYYVLVTYEDYFKDTTIYVFFAGGMVLGMVTFVLHWLIDPQVIFYLDLGLLVFVLAFAAFEEMMKFVILYLKWFRGQHSTTYYGFSFGLGFGATSIIGLVYSDVYFFPERITEIPALLPTALILSLAFIGLHATTGGLIGFGSAKRFKWNMLIVALGLHILFNFLLLWFWRVWYPERLGLAVVLASIGLGGTYYFKKEVMPTSLTHRLSRERRRKMKAELYRKGRKRGEKGPGVPGITFGERPPKKSKPEEE